MKLLHISDLHIGKRFSERSFADDQKYILQQILEMIDKETPDGVMIAGDVYDRAIPSAEAVQILDEFLVALSQKNIPVFLISGNHDSPERLAFGGRLLEANHIYISPVYDGNISPITLEDDYGTINIYLLPFIKPSHVRRFYDDEEIVSYTDAMRVAIAHMNVDPHARNVLITHQFVTGAIRSDSEECSVGGTDNVDACVFDVFDYVALGHIHAPQNCGSKKIRYCGTPLKYSFSEISHQKSVTLVTLAEKGELTVETLPLTPKTDMSELYGAFDTMTEKSFYENLGNRYDYLRITLTDENDIPDAMNHLRKIYPNVLHLRYDNQRTRFNEILTLDEEVEHKSPMTLFSEFYQKQNNQPMTEEQTAVIASIFDDLGGKMV
jgi:exonuclease SbcD